MNTSGPRRDNSSDPFRTQTLCFELVTIQGGHPTEILAALGTRMLSRGVAIVLIDMPLPVLTREERLAAAILGAYQRGQLTAVTAKPVPVHR